jgi:uncharacterized protein (DUF2062 family)
MPRKFLKRFLPSHAAIHANRHVARFGHRLLHHNLWHLHRRSVAGGVAVGMFAGLIPGSNPVQFSVAALLAIAFRVNLPIGVIVTLYSNPLTIVPLYIVAFKLGGLVMLKPDGGLPPFDVAADSWSAWLSTSLDWLITVGKPLLVGIPLLAVLLSIIGYALVRLSWRCYVVYAWRARQRRRHAGGRPS